MRRGGENNFARTKLDDGRCVNAGAIHRWVGQGGHIGPPLRGRIMDDASWGGGNGYAIRRGRPACLP